MNHPERVADTRQRLGKQNAGSRRAALGNGKQSAALQMAEMDRGRTAGAAAPDSSTRSRGESGSDGAGQTLTETLAEPGWPEAPAPAPF